MELFDTLKKLYNDGQYDELHSMFHPLVQVELSQEELTKGVESIHEIWGDIENGAYSHYEYNGTSEGKAYFSLFYRVETTQEGMDILRILVSKEDNEPYELWELHMGE